MGGQVTDRELAFSQTNPVSNRCSQQLAYVSVSKSTSTITIKSEVARFSVEHFSWYDEGRGCWNLRLRDSSGNTSQALARIPHCTSEWTCFFRDGIELVGIIKTQLVEESSHLAEGEPLDHIFCLGISRSMNVSGAVERWGVFFVPRQTWDKAAPKEMTVEFCQRWVRKSRGDKANCYLRFVLKALQHDHGLS